MRTEDYAIFKVHEHSYTTSLLIGYGKIGIQLEFVLENKLPDKTKQDALKRIGFFYPTVRVLLEFVL